MKIEDVKSVVATKINDKLNKYNFSSEEQKEFVEYAQDRICWIAMSNGVLLNEQNVSVMTEVFFEELKLSGFNLDELEILEDDDEQ